MTEQLPRAFLARMEEMLKEEYPAFLDSYHEPRHLGLRVNTLKITVEEFLKISPFHLTPVPWTENGFYYDAEDRPAKHPYYAAGLYYLQEPSAMAPAAFLPVEEDDCVLDLCAAPGGKATELAARLNGTGMLTANEISASRAKALLRNLELFGVSNSFVTNEIPGHLAASMPQFFDKILVDAPCSGEGMFRKDPDVAKSWDEERPEYFARLQKDILENAFSMLKPGGLLLYSTCTFAPLENEGTVSWFLDTFPDMALRSLPDIQGFSKGIPSLGNGSLELEKCIRIFPHKVDGEGHFIALFQKKGSALKTVSSVHTKPDPQDFSYFTAFWENQSPPFPRERIEIRKNCMYYLPPFENHMKGIRFLRNGIFLGELKKNRFEPSQPLALALTSRQYPASLRLSPNDDRILRYQKGETLLLSQTECGLRNGWILVCAGDYPLGWGKLVNGTLKNKYPAGWRIL